MPSRYRPVHPSTRAGATREATEARTSFHPPLLIHAFHQKILNRILSLHRSRSRKLTWYGLVSDHYPCGPMELLLTILFGITGQLEEASRGPRKEGQRRLFSVNGNEEDGMGLIVEGRGRLLHVP